MKPQVPGLKRSRSVNGKLNMLIEFCSLTGVCSRERLLYDVTSEVRSKLDNKVVHVSAKEGTFSKS